jgi:hypothetical protein
MLPMKYYDIYEEEAVTRVCEQWGYGRVMQLASELWSRKDVHGGEFRVGPCAAMTVSCGCLEPHKCDWCEGCGWLTKKVAEIKSKS